MIWVLKGAIVATYLVGFMTWGLFIVTGDRSALLVAVLVSAILLISLPRAERDWSRDYYA